MRRRRYVPDLNVATKEELKRIPGISEDVAEAIVQFRDDRGGIRDFEELMNVDGVNQNHIDHLRPWMTIREEPEDS